ncbi:unnamed protein product [Linum tenue]|uniref:Uncharacterized protein n=1 Tax=Linum tenue TaxID=586396 RepID=A0AAV0HQ09_9ROSI|nr:unnamed protein product [Linum tenue]
MTKKRNKVARPKKELLRLTKGKSGASVSSTKPMFATSERKKELLRPQITGISSPSSTKPMITNSYPFSTAANYSGSSSHQKTTSSEKAFLGSIVIADPYPPQRTEQDVVNNQWLAGLCPTPLPKGQTLTEALLDLATREAALDPLPPDYDTDAEWGDYEGGCCDESHLVKEEPDWDWFRSIMVHPPCPRYEKR